MSAIQSKIIRHAKQQESTAPDENNQSNENDPELTELAQKLLRGIITVFRTFKKVSRDLDGIKRSKSNIYGRKCENTLDGIKARLDAAEGRMENVKKS